MKRITKTTGTGKKDEMKITIRARDVAKGVRKHPIPHTKVIRPDKIYDRRDRSWENWREDV